MNICWLTRHTQEGPSSQQTDVWGAKIPSAFGKGREALVHLRLSCRGNGD